MKSLGYCLSTEYEEFTNLYEIRAAKKKLANLVSRRAVMINFALI